MANPQGRRPQTDFQGMQETWPSDPDDGMGGLVDSQVFGYSEPDVPTFQSPGLTRKQELGSEVN